MGKPTVCIGENKDADQLRAFVFATRIVQSLYFLNTKFHASSCLLFLRSPIGIGPVRKPHCWFSHEWAHILIYTKIYVSHCSQNFATAAYHQIWVTLSLFWTPHCTFNLCHIILISLRAQYKMQPRDAKSAGMLLKRQKNSPGMFQLTNGWLLH